MIAKNYQPVKLNEGLVICKCDSKDSQLAQDGDITQFQLTQEVCNYASDLITNGDFDDPQGTGWSYSGFNFVSDVVTSTNSVDSVLKTSNKIMGVDFSYQLEIDILVNTGEPLLLYFGSNKIAELSTAGKFQISGVCKSETTSERLIIVSPKNNATTIERIALYNLESDIGLVVLDVDGVPIHLRTLAQDIADSNYTMFKIDRDVITVSFPWDFITDSVNGLNRGRGCYQLGILGKCQNTGGFLGVFDSEMNIPTFGTGNYLTDSTFPWRSDIDNTVKIEPDTGVMRYQSGTSSNAIVTEFNQWRPQNGVRYDFEVKINTITPATGAVDISVGGVSASSLTTTGVHNFSLTAIFANNLEIEFSDSAGDPIEIEYLRIVVVQAASIALIEPDISTNIFDFKDLHLCTVLLAAANNEDAFGHRFESAFYTPKARLKGNLRSDKYDQEVEAHINGFNEKIIDYFEQRKLLSLQLQNVPDYLNDWLSLWRGFSKVYVDGVDYIVEEDPDFNYNRFCDAAKVEIILGEKRQALKNTNQKGLVAVSDINNVLVRMFDQNETIIFIDGEEIALNG